MSAYHLGHSHETAQPHLSGSATVFDDVVMKTMKDMGAKCHPVLKAWTESDLVISCWTWITCVVYGLGSTFRLPVMDTIFGHYG